MTTFFSLCFEILTWCLVCGCIMITYRSNLCFVPVQWILAELWPLNLKFGQIFSCHHFFSLYLEILTWFLVYECIMMSYRSVYISLRSNDFWPSYGPWTLKFGQIFCCYHFISLCFEILAWFGIRNYNEELQIKVSFCSLGIILKHLRASLIFTFRHI